MKIWLDDLRPAPAGYVHVKHVFEAKKLIEENEVERISLDNDLGSGEEEGRAVIDWIEERYHKGLQIPKAVDVHTQNPVARYYMRSVWVRVYGRNRCPPANNSQTP